VTRVLSVCTVGGITAEFTAGAIAVPDQIIDYTWGRKSTFFEGAEQPVVHVDFTHPYDEPTRELLLAAAADAGESVVPRGTYAAVQGPRLETAAEVNRLDRDGAHLVGMTGMPEAALARELGLAYAALAVVANPAAGRAGSRESISLEAISQVLDKAMGRVRTIIGKAVVRHGRP
jgi:5'-methylthioadenosine phosphorylase